MTSSCTGSYVYQHKHFAWCYGTEMLSVLFCDGNPVTGCSSQQRIFSAGLGSFLLLLSWRDCWINNEIPVIWDAMTLVWHILSWQRYDAFQIRKHCQRYDQSRIQSTLLILTHVHSFQKSDPKCEILTLHSSESPCLSYVKQMTGVN